MALFKSYAVIYLAIGTAICETLFVFYSCANDDTETAYLPTVPFFAGLSRFLMLCPAVPLYLTFVPLSTVATQSDRHRAIALTTLYRGG